jgi:hypothetical protein
MKIFATLVTVLMFSTPFISTGQKVANKNAKFKTFLNPLVPVKGVSTIGFKVHQGGDTPFTNGSFKIKKLKNLEGNPEVKRYKFMDYELTDSIGDLTFEIAFDKVASTNTASIYTYKAPCVRDDNDLTKDDIMECDAYAYKQEFKSPCVMRVVDKDGKTVFAEEYNKGISVTFGESDLNPFLKKADLEAYYSSHPKVLETKAYKVQLDRCLDRVDEVLYFMAFTHDFNIGSGKGKDFDYAKLDEAQDNALKVFDTKGQTDFSGLKGPIAVWEEELKTQDLASKEARISRKVAAGLNENLAASYMYLKDFDKAIEHVLECRKLAKMSNSGNVIDRADRLRRRIFHYKRSFELNGDIVLGEDRKKARDFKVFLSENRRGKSFLTNDSKFAEFKTNVAEMEAANSENKEKENDALESASKGKKNKYRNRILSSATQGNMLVLNNYYDSELKGNAMPSAIGELVELTQITANKMEITSLPDNIGDLKDLGILKLKGCSLTELPESFGGLANLKTLDLSDNKLTTLPASIKGCTSLKSVKLTGNNISDAEMKKIIGWLPKKCKVK